MIFNIQILYKVLAYMYVYIYKIYIMYYVFNLLNE